MTEEVARPIWRGSYVRYLGSHEGANGLQIFKNVDLLDPSTGIIYSLTCICYSLAKDICCQHQSCESQGQHEIFVAICFVCWPVGVFKLTNASGKKAEHTMTASV